MRRVSCAVFCDDPVYTRAAVRRFRMREQADCETSSLVRTESESKRQARITALSNATRFKRIA